MDRRHRAHGLAQPAVDALVRLDVERAPALIDAVDRAGIETGLVLHVDAGIGDDVGHFSLPHRFALLDEGAHALLAVLRLQGFGERGEKLAARLAAESCAVRRTTCLIARTESGAQASTSSTQRATAASSSARGTTSLTRPMRKASAAGMRLPVSSTPIAR